MLFEALHNTSGVQKASGYFLDGVQALSWVVDGLREDWLSTQVVDHIGDAYRNFLDATIEIDKTILAVRHGTHKDIAKLDDITATLETQRRHIVLLHAESSFHATGRAKLQQLFGVDNRTELSGTQECGPALEEQVESAVEQELKENARVQLGHETCTLDLHMATRSCAESPRSAIEREAFAFDLRMTHALERDACALELRIAKREAAQNELEVLRDGFIKCMMQIGKYGIHIRDPLEMVHELTLLILSLCSLSVHFDILHIIYFLSFCIYNFSGIESYSLLFYKDSLLGNSENGIVAQQVKGLMYNMYRKAIFVES
eukprot:Phypoly_transcript_12170.p1 GENE.Phypoly_transcript_12170~~Phypoly_transcript_12170.p1  ORF type:complete len:317 (+),score=46.53 Phypoly_transcript_12170:55-1005(+)